MKNVDLESVQFDSESEDDIIIDLEMVSDINQSLI